MNVPIDREYLQRRRRQSLALAEAAKDPGIARIHHEFAKEYAHKLDTPSGAAENERAPQA